MRGGEELDQLDEFGRFLVAAMNSPAYARASERAVLRLLPRRIRLRLWWTRRIDGTATCLACHGHLGAAEAVWRITGHWRTAKARNIR